MKLFAPKYYNEFACIADKCSHTCCVGWEIDIDEITLEKYKNLSNAYSEKLIPSIDMSGVPHFRLLCGDRCPHLNESRLCEIILNVGEDYLCDICREHPRFYNPVGDRMEVGLGMACEEACRLILSSDNYCELIEVGETEDLSFDSPFDIKPLRDRIYSVLSDGCKSHRTKLDNIYKEFDVSPYVLTDSEWSEVVSSLEYLDESHRTLFSCYSSAADAPAEYDKILERALAYFVYRHCAGACDKDEFRASLGFCLFCERLLASMLAFEKTVNERDVVRLARILSEELEYSEENTESIKFEF